MHLHGRFFTGLLSCLFLATLGLARPGTGHAKQPSPPPGHAVACARHETNRGNSNANGLECGPTSPTLTATISPGTVTNSCDLTVRGTGLKPGTFLYVSPGGEPLVDKNFVPIVVGSDSTVNITTFSGNIGGTYTLTATTAEGDSITTTFVPSC